MNPSHLYLPSTFARMSNLLSAVVVIPRLATNIKHTIKMYIHIPKILHVYIVQKVT